MKVEVLFVSRSYIEGTYEDFTFRVQGEAYLPGYGSPSFVVYLSSLSIADGDSKRHASPEESEAIRAGITSYMEGRHQTVEFEP